MDKEFSRKIAQFCKEVTAKYNLTPLFIPMQDERDLALCSSLSSQTGGLCLRGLSCTEVRTIIAGARFVCGMRLHLLIYAVAEAVPAIGLSYDPKIDAFFRDIGCSRIMSASDIDGQRLFAFAQEALVRDKDVLTQKAQEMARRSKISMQKLKELLEQ